MVIIIVIIRSKIESNLYKQAKFTFKGVILSAKILILKKKNDFNLYGCDAILGTF